MDRFGWLLLPISLGLSTLEFSTNVAFAEFWTVVKDWSEMSRYEQKGELEARRIYEAITHNPDGVLKWITLHW